MISGRLPDATPDPAGRRRSTSCSELVATTSGSRRERGGTEGAHAITSGVTRSMRCSLWCAGGVLWNASRMHRLRLGETRHRELSSSGSPERVRGRRNTYFSTTTMLSSLAVFSAPALRSRLFGVGRKVGRLRATRCHSNALIWLERFSFSEFPVMYQSDVVTITHQRMSLLIHLDYRLWRLFACRTPDLCFAWHSLVCVGSL